VDFVAARYGLHPDDAKQIDMFDSVVLYHAAVRNSIRDRIAAIGDMVATGEMSAEIKHFDKHGREIKGEGRSDPVGFKEHMKRLYAFLGLDDRGRSEPVDKEYDKRMRQQEAADTALEFFSKMLGGG